jgi:5'-deoxynucleotidase YfbR-like HD superfamily hydrolase
MVYRPIKGRIVMSQTPVKPDIHRVIDFHRLLHQFQSVQRVVHIPKTHAHENDTEHSYNLAMMAWFLSTYFPKLDQNLVIRYALVHDLVEVHAGDTYIYADQAQLDSKQAREAAALQQLTGEWPDFADLTKTIGQYEQRNDEESRFIYALDKIMPIIVIFLAEGYSWHKEKVALDQLHEAKKHKVAVAPEIAPYYDELYALLLQHPHYFPAQDTTPVS